MNKSKTIMLFLPAVIALQMFFTSCNNRVYYDKVKDVGEQWNASDKVAFTVDVTDTLSPFDFYINIRNSVDYDFSNVFFFLKTTFPDGRFSVDTVNIWLAKPSGEWLGSGFGKFRDNQILFKRHGRSSSVHFMRFEFEQAMRRKTLSGIASVGIRIEYSNTNK